MPDKYDKDDYKDPDYIVDQRLVQRLEVDSSNPALTPKNLNALTTSQYEVCVTFKGDEK